MGHTIGDWLAGRIGYRLVKQKRNSLSGSLGFADLLRFYLATTYDPGQDVFLQIGANDGVEKDPLRALILEFGLRGVLVEPQPDAFSALKANYAGQPGLTFLDVAVGEEAGERPLWVLDERHRFHYEARAGVGASGLASFDKRHLVRHLVKNAPDLARTEAAAERCIASVTVQVVPLNALLDAHVHGRLQILQIDAEGYDGRILRTLDFDRYRPHIVNYESKHLSRDEQAACEALLHAHGYVTFGHGSDTCGLLAERGRAAGTRPYAAGER